MTASPAYDATRARVETYFDRTATRTWERLTSDAPVSRIRQTVRAGRDRMRALMLSRLPLDLRGARILDAGCGAGQMSAELAARGADVLGVDLSPQLIGIAEARMPAELRPRVQFVAGDMLDTAHGTFDAVFAMDSLIYYDRHDLNTALGRLAQRTELIVFTVAPKTTLLTAMWWAGKLFPRSDRSPVMVPQAPGRLNAASVGRIASGFYISECMEMRR
ncbi:magnesium protoporphyrin IX methyltransferase [Ovoidimarina sediminis]|uniref:magnesium protoporphyrin IX methyltransferase n=1 Tax=Ovoidimarina sediminis TaxID=3079856 RepID=UPI00290ECE33|nr:magnesium protoporphyrin IX methyltransferase [Rhodophyticola sp. MJ-SS7]MDU8944498.1 magnesium protoporphyrin IX methyltransferase [Rhodophyticola sp. MJ-SS7]